jgi:hypothetical protein
MLGIFYLSWEDDMLFLIIDNPTKIAPALPHKNIHLAPPRAKSKIKNHRLYLTVTPPENCGVLVHHLAHTGE